MVEFTTLRETTWKLPEDPACRRGSWRGKLVECLAATPCGPERFYVRENVKDVGSNRVLVLEIAAAAHAVKYLAALVGACDPLDRAVVLSRDFTLARARASFDPGAPGSTGRRPKIIIRKRLMRRVKSR